MDGMKQLTGLLAILLLSTSLQAADKPNIVLILIDDMPWYGTTVAMDDDIAWSRMTFRNMPSMDRFARQSMRFSSAYASAPI